MGNLKSESPDFVPTTFDQFFNPSRFLRGDDLQNGRLVQKYDSASFDEDMELVGEGTYGKVFKAHIKRKKILSEVITPVKSEGNNQEA